MGVHVSRSTMPGGLTPICNDCGVSLCWDIADADYAEIPSFWDSWICRDCNGGEPMRRPTPTPDTAQGGTDDSTDDSGQVADD